jgi:putative phosphoribosyl transferase
MNSAEGAVQGFADRRHAGASLAAAFSGRIEADAVVLGLPRGGVIVAAALAQALDLDLDVYVARKLRAPINQELAIGAVAEDGPTWIDKVAARSLAIGLDYLEREEQFQRAEIARQVRAYRGERQLTELARRQVVIADDGLATGATMLAVVRGVRYHSPRAVVAASPVSSRSSLAKLAGQCDDVLSLISPENFWAVGQFYSDFTQVSDQDVVVALAKARSA